MNGNENTIYKNLWDTVTAVLRAQFIVINAYIKTNKEKRRNQDGGVERRALTPSCKNTRITTCCWTITDRKTLELTKKDTPHPKTKEKPK